MSPQTLRAACKHCGNTIKYTQAKAGKTGRCPACGHRITLPDAIHESMPEEEYRDEPLKETRPRVHATLPAFLPENPIREKAVPGYMLATRLAVANGLAAWKSLCEPSMTTWTLPRLAAAVNWVAYYAILLSGSIALVFLLVMIAGAAVAGMGAWLKILSSAALLTLPAMLLAQIAVRLLCEIISVPFRIEERLAAMDEKQRGESRNAG